MQLVTTWGSYAWKGWATLTDITVAPDDGVWTLDHGGWITRWDAVTGDVVRRIPLDPPGTARTPVPAYAALLPDGGGIVVSRADGSLALYDLESGAQRWRISAVGQGSQFVPVVDRIAVSADGAVVVTAAPGEIEPCVRVWDVATGIERFRIAGAARAIALAPDGVHAILGGTRGVVLATGEAAFAIPGPPKATVAAYSPDGAHVVAGNEDGQLWYWEVAKLRDAAPAPVWQNLNTNTWGDKSPIKQIEISRDGRKAVTTSTLSYQAWFLANGRRVQNIAFQGTWRAAVTPDGTRAFGIGLQRQRVRHVDLLRDAETRPAYEHEDTVTCLAISPDGTLVASGGRDRTIQLRDLASGRPRGALAAGDVRAIAFTPDGNHLLHTDDTGGGMHAIATRARTATWAWFALKLRYFVDVVATPDGTGAIFTDEDGTAIRIDLRTGAETWRRARASAKWLAFAGDKLIVTTTAIALQVWNAATGETVESFAHADRLKTQPQIVDDDDCFSALAIHTGRGLVKRELSTGDEIRHFPGSEAADGVLVRSPDRRHAVTATPAGLLQLWDVKAIAQTGVWDLAATHDHVTCAAFVPDGRSFLAGTNRGVILRFAI